MKRTLLPPPMHRGYRFGAVLLAVSLLAGPGLASLATAVEPAPSASATPDSPATPPAPQPAQAEPAPTAPATASPGATPTASAPAATGSTPAPAPAPAPALDPSSPAGKAAMAEAIGPGGAEMGQGSPRVSGSRAAASEGTWMPTFGVQGLDVSGHQPGVNWQQQWNMGARFAYVKATEANYYTNEVFGSQYQGSRNVGMIRGAYHFAIPNWSSGADQARYFVQNGGGWSADGYTLPPVLDFEFNPYANRTINGYYMGNTCYDMSPTQLRSWVHEFGNTMRSLTGRLPMIYTNTNWWRQCLGEPTTFGDYPLWVAAYPLTPTNNAGPVPASWDTYSMWQYSDSGPFAGDSNVWNGDYDSLRRFAAGKAVPTGSFDEVSVARSGSDVSLRARGWAVDLSRPGSASEAHIYLTGPDGATTGHAWLANKSRPDVDHAFGYGPSHGFDGTIRITRSGTYKACAYAIGAFGNTSLGCKTIQASGVEAPVGSFDSLGQSRTPEKVSLHLKGWAADTANPAASSFADAYVTDPAGKTTGYRMTANASRPDVDSATGLGAAHGFDTLIEAKMPGTYRACVHAIGQHSNLLLGCREIAVAANPAPMGSYDSLSLSQAPNSANLQVSGWALDPAKPEASIPVHVYVRFPDGSNPGYPVTADKPRPDVNRALATVGDHGFQASVPLSQAGNYTACAYAIPVAPIPAGNTLLGCRSIRVDTTPATKGHLDSAALKFEVAQTSIRVSGWTLDPSFPAVSNPAHIYVTSPDGTRKGYAFTANRPRPDVNSALGTVGDHGFTAFIPVTLRGQYQVCAYGVAVSKLSAGNSLLGCKSVRH